MKIKSTNQPYIYSLFLGLCLLKDLGLKRSAGMRWACGQGRGGGLGRRPSLSILVFLALLEKREKRWPLSALPPCVTNWLIRWGLPRGWAHSCQASGPLQTLITNFQLSFRKSLKAF